MTIPLQSILLILFSHWIGDYLLQDNFIAAQKGASLKWLSVHVLLYVGVLLIATLFLFPWRTAFVFAGINGAFHFITDFVTSRFTVKHKQNPRIFYLIVGLDQFIHTATLVTTAYLFVG